MEGRETSLESLSRFRGRTKWEKIKEELLVFEYSFLFVAYCYRGLCYQNFPRLFLGGNELDQVLFVVVFQGVHRIADAQPKARKRCYLIIVLLKVKEPFGKSTT